MRKAGTVLWVAFLVIGIVTVHLWREGRVEGERNAAMEARVAALESTPAPTMTVAVAAESAPSPVGAQAVAASQAASPTTPAAARPADAAQTNLAAALRQQLETPQGQEYMRSIARMAMERQFPDMAKELGITDEEARKFLDLLVEQAVGVSTTALERQPASDPAARDERARQVAARQQQFEAEAAALLGANYPKWKEYERTTARRQQESARRQQAEQLRMTVSSASDPLDDAQFTAMQEAIAAEQRRINQESPGLSRQQQLQRMPENNRRLVDVASRYLSPSQLERYRRHLEQEQAMASTVITLLDTPQGASR